MSNQQANRAVWGAVDLAVGWAVHRAVAGAVDEAEYTAVSALGPEHPALQDFLRG
jgi:hypothetical protein